MNLDECYRALDLAPGATPAEIRKAWRDLSKVWHPDRFMTDPPLAARAAEKLKAINHAYTILTSDQVGAEPLKRTAQSQPASDVPPRRATPTRQDDDPWWRLRMDTDADYERHRHNLDDAVSNVVLRHPLVAVPVTLFRGVRSVWRRMTK